MNFQNIPRDDKVIKRAFIPKLDVLLFFDYKNIEPRLTAYYMARMGDDKLAWEFREGIDPYINMAQELSIERQAAKMLFLSQVYGGGVYTVSQQLGVSQPQAKRILTSFHKARPGIKALAYRVRAIAEERGYVKTLYGRHLHPEDGQEHKMLNKLIQGCAADIMRDALRRVHTFLWNFDSHLVSTIHDELIIDAAAGDILGLTKEIPKLMKNEQVEELVPMEIDIEWTTTNWAEKKSYNV